VDGLIAVFPTAAADMMMIISAIRRAHLARTTLSTCASGARHVRYW
jgi:hypothetical protein